MAARQPKPAIAEPLVTARPRPDRLSARKGAASLPIRALRHVLVLATLVSVGVAAGILALGGWGYYHTPLAIRGYHPLHHVLEPAGTLGRPLGIAGTALMLVMQLYSLRKSWRPLAAFGSLPRWLEFHILCGIVGPVLITFHTSFKFNDIVSVAYWSMVLVVLSGFVGRYLYVRIPRTLRGQEMTMQELETRAAELRTRLLDAAPPPGLLLRVEAFEAAVVPADVRRRGWADLVLGDLRLRSRLRRLRREIGGAEVDPTLVHDALALIAERATMLRHIAYLRKTKQLFDLWHVFHRPLALLMLVIVALHVGTALYFGYAFGGR